MIEVTGNLWTYPADVRVITTNGFVKKNGECVMGRGCAFEAKQRFKRLPFELGTKIREGGNHVFWFPDYKLVSFPVKHHWYEKADLRLIEQSAEELAELTDDITGGDVLIPRPGCGNGQLSWDEVRPVIEAILTDDHFKIISF